MKKLKLFSLALMALFATSMWAAASTTSDDKYATGTIDFSTIGELAANTTYWHNGVKFFSGNSANVSKNNSAWSEAVAIPAYISNKTAGKETNKAKWGSSAGKQYTMSGFACSQHTIGIHVNQACTLTVVVNKNLDSDTDDAGISASLDATSYGTEWTTSTYKVAGTALTVSSARADKTNYPGRYTLTIVITEDNLTDGEAVVKMFNGSSGTGAGKLFCWESITVTPAASYTITYDANGGEGEMENSTNTISACTFTAPDGYEFKEWNTAADGKGTAYAAGATATSDLDLYAIWQVHATSSDATLADLTVAGETVEGFDAATTVYNVELAFGTSAVPTVTGEANSAYAKSIVVTPATLLPGATTIVVTAEDNSTKTYTINFTVAESKVIDLVWKTGQNACAVAGSQTTTIKSDDSKVSTYIKQITFDQAEGTGDDAVEGSSLNTGKKEGNTIIIQTQSGYLFTAMSFFGKIESADEKCFISTDGGSNWTDLASTSANDATYCDVISDASTNDIRIKSNGVAGVWIRNMQLTIKKGSKTPTSISNTSDAEKAQKRIENGQLVIEKNGQVFNAMGQTIR